MSGLILKASGEAEFISDSIPSRTDLYCDVVLSQVGKAEIDVIDSSEAERLPGFVQIVTSKNYGAYIKCFKNFKVWGILVNCFAIS